MLELGVKLLLAYLLGTLLGSLLLGRLRGVDIRNMGSGNAGATNALRTQGKLFGFLVLLVDIAKGLFAVWDQPALDTLSSMRAQGIDIPITTVDLGLQSAIEIAKGGPLKATGSQRPYDQGVAEALAMMKSLIGQTPPAWVGVQSLPVVQSNVLESYKTVFHKDPPQELLDASNGAKPACN